MERHYSGLTVASGQRRIFGQRVVHLADLNIDARARDAYVAATTDRAVFAALVRGRPSHWHNCRKEESTVRPLARVAEEIVDLANADAPEPLARALIGFLENVADDAYPALMQPTLAEVLRDESDCEARENAITAQMAAEGVTAPLLDALAAAWDDEIATQRAGVRVLRRLARAKRSGLGSAPDGPRAA